MVEEELSERVERVEEVALGAVEEVQVDKVEEVAVVVRQVQEEDKLEQVDDKTQVPPQLSNPEVVIMRGISQLQGVVQEPMHPQHRVKFVISREFVRE